MITADTITDEQIHALWCEAVDAGDVQLMRICKRAIGDRVQRVALSRTGCRARCAEILSARKETP